MEKAALTPLKLNILIHTVTSFRYHNINQYVSAYYCRFCVFNYTPVSWIIIWIVFSLLDLHRVIAATVAAVLSLQLSKVQVCKWYITATTTFTVITCQYIYFLASTLAAERRLSETCGKSPPLLNEQLVHSHPTSIQQIWFSPGSFDYCFIIPTSTAAW